MILTPHKVGLLLGPSFLLAAKQPNLVGTCSGFQIPEPEKACAGFMKLGHI